MKIKRVAFPDRITIYCKSSSLLCTVKRTEHGNVDINSDPDSGVTKTAAFALAKYDRQNPF